MKKVSKNKDKVTDNEFKKMKRVKQDRRKYVDKSFHFYFSYALRIFFMIFFVFVIGTCSYLCFEKSFKLEKGFSLDYTENASVDHKVKFKDNSVYDQGILNPVGTYVSDSIDDISTDINYVLNLSQISNIKYEYKVDAIREIKDNKTGAVLSKKISTLVPKTKKNLKNTRVLDLKQNVNLDYSSYNEEARKLGESSELHALEAGVNGNIYLRLYIDLYIDNDNVENPIKHSNVVDVVIPLLVTNVNVSLADELDETHNFKVLDKEKLVNSGLLVIGIILFVVDIIFILLIISFIRKTRTKKSKYEVLRDGLLRDYDELIVNVKKLPNKLDYKVIDCYSFNELLDACRLLNKPILYNELIKKEKCAFVLINDNEMYRFVLKEVDIDF